MKFDIDEVTETQQYVVVNEPLWLTADRERVVAAGDPEAASLFASAGKRISREDAERYGLVKAAAKKAAKESPSEDKQATPAEDKQAKPSAKKRSQPRKG